MFLNKSSISKALPFVVLITLLASVNGYSEEKNKLRKVEKKNVCMTNNKDMGKPQLPIKIGDKTYYGCCKMCVENMTKNVKVRYAVDPVTGNKVDKANAVLGAKPNGDILYFESEDSFQAFQKQKGK